MNIILWFNFCNRQRHLLTKYWFSNLFIFATWWCKPLINLKLGLFDLTEFVFKKYQRSMTPGCKDMGLENVEFEPWDKCVPYTENVHNVTTKSQWSLQKEITHLCYVKFDNLSLCMHTVPKTRELNDEFWYRSRLCSMRDYFVNIILQYHSLKVLGFPKFGLQNFYP